VLRAQRGLSLTDAAELAGIQRQTLAKLERGEARAHDVTLSKLAKGYGIPVEVLLEGEIQEKPKRRVPRRDRGDDDEFEAIIDNPEQRPQHFHVEVSPIDQLEDVLYEFTPKYRSVEEAIEAFKRAREEKEKKRSGERRAAQNA